MNTAEKEKNHTQPSGVWELVADTPAARLCSAWALTVVWGRTKKPIPSGPRHEWLAVDGALPGKAPRAGAAERRRQEPGVQRRGAWSWAPTSYTRRCVFPKKQTKVAVSVIEASVHASQPDPCKQLDGYNTHFTELMLLVVKHMPSCASMLCPPVRRKSALSSCEISLFWSQMGRFISPLPWGEDRTQSLWHGSMRWGARHHAGKETRSERGKLRSWI